MRFKAVLDRDTGVCRGFGFVNLDDPKLTDAVIEQFNNREYGGNQLRVEVSERRDSRNNDRGGDRRRGPGGGPAVARKSVDKVVTAEPADKEAPDPRWAGELAKLKDPGQPEGLGLKPFLNAPPSPAALDLAGGGGDFCGWLPATER